MSVSVGEAMVGEEKRERGRGREGRKRGFV